jgi:hypothetical protein
MDHMDDHEDKQIPTIFHDILVSKLSPAEKKLDRISQEDYSLDPKRPHVLPSQRASETTAFDERTPESKSGD